MKKYLIEDIKINIEDLTRTKDREAVIKKLSLDEQKVKNFSIERKSLDARKRKSEGIFYVYSVSFRYPFKPKARGVKISQYSKNETEFIIPKAKRDIRPVVVGSGPAGLFAALYLSKMGYEPLVLERGQDVRDRVKTVNAFFESGRLDTESNVQFGLGGAGTFSDGKLNSRIKSPLRHEVLKTFVSCGAPSRILYESKPHLGTDRLRTVVDDMRALIEFYGGQIMFEKKVTDIDVKDGKICSVTVNGEETIETECVILAVGNSARDTFRMLHAKGVSMSSKPFAVGYRVEHLRKEIDFCCYDRFYEHPRLGAASYSLTFNDPETRKGVYSFCNCPGGVIIAGASEENRLVTNGMSFSGRNMTNTNSAIVVNVNSEDFGTGVLDGMHFQERIEERAFALGGGEYAAPYMTIREFLGKPGGSDVKPSYRPKSRETDLSGLFDERITGSVRHALNHFGTFFETFDNGIITGAETRTSSPVRINRNKTTLESENIRGLYPVGEGAGYAGGILSSAVDGIKAAMAINEY